MARLYSNENFSLRAVEALRALGHDVLTSMESGKANQRIPDDAVLEYATSLGRAVITYNRRDFMELHRQDPHHAGIIVCTVNHNPTHLAGQIDQAMTLAGTLPGQLVRVRRGN